jgi:hypothetical protein
LTLRAGRTAGAHEGLPSIWDLTGLSSRHSGRQTALRLQGRGSRRHDEAPVDVHQRTRPTAGLYEPQRSRPTAKNSSSGPSHRLRRHVSAKTQPRERWISIQLTSAPSESRPSRPSRCLQAGRSPLPLAQVYLLPLSGGKMPPSLPKRPGPLDIRWMARSNWFLGWSDRQVLT